MQLVHALRNLPARNNTPQVQVFVELTCHTLSTLQCNFKLANVAYQVTSVCISVKLSK